jgi:hypothetical protein
MINKIYKLIEDRTWDKENNGVAEVKFTGTENECFAWIHKNTSYSFDYALKHGGYKLVDAGRTEEKILFGSNGKRI